MDKVIFKFYTTKGHRYLTRTRRDVALRDVGKMLEDGESVMFFSTLRHTKRWGDEVGKLHPNKIKGEES